MSQYHDEAFLLVRLVVGYIFIYHGLPKLRKPEGMAQGLGWPKGAIMLIGLVELLGGLGVGLGVYIQVCAILLALVMVGAGWMKITKWKTPFFTMTATGWEYDLILFAVCLFIAAHGASMYSLMM
ncbi:DoxX family protein [Candidatus Parcubacteria bacterium]|nr:DoxX family protein [Candidatus Parcubacteria bacterium]